MRKNTDITRKNSPRIFASRPSLRSNFGIFSCFCLAGLSRSLAYKNSKGESFTSQKQDVLLHVVMHSAYHRGQIAADMRAAGFTPAYTDFVHAVRQGFVE